MKKIIYGLARWIYNLTLLAVFLGGVVLLAIALYDMYLMVVTSGYQQ